MKRCVNVMVNSKYSESDHIWAVTEVTTEMYCLLTVHCSLRYADCGDMMYQ